MPIEIYSPESVGFSSSRLARIKDVMQDQVNQGNFAGISTLIARHGKVIHFEQVGLKDKEQISLCRLIPCFGFIL